MLCVFAQAVAHWRSVAREGCADTPHFLACLGQDEEKGAGPDAGSAMAVPFRGLWVVQNVDYVADRLLTLLNGAERPDEVALGIALVDLIVDFELVAEVREDPRLPALRFEGWCSIVRRISSISRRGAGASNAYASR